MYPAVAMVDMTLSCDCLVAGVHILSWKREFFGSALKKLLTEQCKLKSELHNGSRMAKQRKMRSCFIILTKAKNWLLETNNYSQQTKRIYFYYIQTNKLIISIPFNFCRTFNNNGTFISIPCQFNGLFP